MIATMAPPTEEADVTNDPRELTQQRWTAAHESERRDRVQDGDGDGARSALLGLTLFARRVDGRVILQAGKIYGWQVVVEWHTPNGQRRIFAEDWELDAACVLCRGLLAHALASGVA